MHESFKRSTLLKTVANNGYKYYDNKYNDVESERLFLSYDVDNFSKLYQPHHTHLPIFVELRMDKLEILKCKFVYPDSPLDEIYGAYVFDTVPLKTFKDNDKGDEIGMLSVRNLNNARYDKFQRLDILNIFDVSSDKAVREAFDALIAYTYTFYVESHLCGFHYAIQALKRELLEYKS